jgi:hypothetical protein
MPPRAFSRPLLAQALGEMHRLPNNGNSSHAPESHDNHVGRIEAVLRALKQQLAMQVQRIADVQAELERAVADRPPKPSH